MIVSYKKGYKFESALKIIDRYFAYFIYDRARVEAVNSQLPGRQDGPADACRHIIAAAEVVRRRYLESIVRTWGNILDWDHSYDLAAMKRHNNDERFFVLSGNNLELDSLYW